MRALVAPGQPKCKDLKPDLGLDVRGSQLGRVRSRQGWKQSLRTPPPPGQGRNVSQLQEGPDKREQQGKEM